MKTLTAVETISQKYCHSVSDQWSRGDRLGRGYSSVDHLGDATRKKQRDLHSLNAILYPTPKLGSVLGESLTGVLEREPGVVQAVPAAPLPKPSEDLLQRLCRWFDRYCMDGLEYLLPEQSAQLTDANIAVLKKGFAHNSLLLQNACILSAFWIRSPQDWQADGDIGLLEHLFVQYTPPAFLKVCWSQTVDEHSVRWLLCFLAYAQGGSLKALAKHFNWKVASNKLWHQLFSCPANLNPLHAVLYAEFKRLGGWDEDLGCLMANEAYVIDLLEPASEEARDFWYDTCRWTISRQFDLPAAEHNKILWWARHQFTEQARHGGTYRLQGRSKARVLESIAAYEQEQLQRQRARERMAARARQVSMARLEERERMLEAFYAEQGAHNRAWGYYYDRLSSAKWDNHGWNWSITIYGKNWRFVELTSSEALSEEGEAMEHCVGSYVADCLDGASAIFSLRCGDSRKATIEVSPAGKQLIQVQGYCNAEPQRYIVTLVNDWMERIVQR